MPPTTRSRAVSGGDQGDLPASGAAARAASVESRLAEAEPTAKLATKAVQELRKDFSEAFLHANEERDSLMEDLAKVKDDLASLRHFSEARMTQKLWAEYADPIEERISNL